MYDMQYNERTGRSMGVRITQRPNIPIPEEKIETYSVEGRDGSLTVRTGKYKDIEIEILMGFYEKRSLWAERLREVKKWLHSQGQGRLKFADDPGYYYKVKYVKAKECERQLGKFGTFAATFVCEPYVYLDSGDIDIPIGTLVNEYAAAHPVYHISGEGQCTLTVNKNTMVCNVGQILTIDTDRMVAYREDGTIHNADVTGDYEGLWLIQGENTVTATSGFKVTVQPMWRRL
ncbi:distal tail protein Dit [Murimonas intestini]|uniref:Phage tail component-like protein n=1 Tax=Murimonas intestini TaxID=1337051 RepID=A0AB73SZU6_9FIRM|nr:distal tail protein Dit [Murimonas intestini]MCR1842752.1 phage tail family protein [Murimonas intestini]MCR1867909.1 phage tail family protein [Murimonas intestini]MCR1885261.1 phage tail family protein [Murimonas intestini]